MPKGVWVSALSSFFWLVANLHQGRSKEEEKADQKDSKADQLHVKKRREAIQVVPTWISVEFGHLHC